MITYAIEVFFNNEFDKYIREIWKRCYEEGISSYMYEINGAEPHIALAVYSNVNIDKLKYDFDYSFTEKAEGIHLFFDSVAIFQYTKTTYLPPNTKSELIHLMSSVHKNFQDYEAFCNDFYKENRWYPHVSLAKNDSLENAKKTMNIILDNFSPQIAKINRVGLVEIIHEQGKCVSCSTITSKALL